jgi:hypothetical protein
VVPNSPDTQRVRARPRALLRACLAIVVVAVLVLLGCDTAHAAAPWTTITSPGSQSSLNPIPEMAWDGSGLWIAWGNDTTDVEVSRWNGATWTSYPQPVNELTKNKMPSITWDGTKPWVAWNDDSYNVQVAYWTGATWTQIASPGGGTSLFSTPDVFWANGALHVAWQDSSHVVLVARWTGAAWTDLCSPGSGGTANAYPSLGWDGTTLWVAYAQAGGVTAVSKWVSGTTWTAHSTDSSGTAFNTVPSLAFVGTRPYLVHEAAGHASEVTWWDGTQWAAAPSPGGGPTSYAYGSLEWTGSKFYVSYVTDPDTINVASYTPTAPAVTSGLGQFEADAVTSIAGGAWTRFGAVSALVLRATLTDPEASEQLTPWFELQPNGASFTGTCGQDAGAAMFSGAAVAAPTGGSGVAATASITGLANNTTYAWRACTVDRFGFPGPWLARGGSPDFKVDSSIPTAAPSSPANGAVGQSSTPTLQAVYTDPAPANSGTVDVQVCTTSGCGTIVQSGTSSSVASGATASWTVPSALAASTTYWWQARGVDSVGNVGAWSAARSFTTAVANPPATPVHVSPASGSATAATTPTLTASFSDPDGGTGTLSFEVCSVAMAAGQTCAGAGGSLLASGTSGSVASGSNATWTPGSALAAGTVFWHARASDGSLQSAWSASWQLRVGTPSMTLSVDAATVALGMLGATIDSTGTSTLTITTDSSGGYQLTARDESDAWGSDATSGGGLIADWTGTSAAPTAWATGVAGGMGMTVLSVSSPAAKDTARWGTGTLATDFTNNRYAGLKASTDTYAHTRASYAAAADTVTVGWRIDVPATQLAGTYDATVTWTATALP